MSFEPIDNDDVDESISFNAKFLLGVSFGFVVVVFFVFLLSIIV